MNKVSLKKNLSSIQVLRTLLLLLDGDYSMNELIKILNKNNPEGNFNNSVISKYINTCRYIGIKIPKINNKYYVASLPFGFELSINDIDVLKYIQNIVKKDMTAKNFAIFNNLFDKISKYSNKQIEKVEKEEFSMSLDLFERAVAQKRKIKLMFKNRDELECIPISITQNGKKTFFNVFNKRIRNIDSSRLSGMKFIDEQYIELFDSNQVAIFNLKGPLAKRYEARDNETIQQNNDGTITVINKNENKDILLSRLLRYQDLCEIVQPKGYREEFKQIISNTLNNYGVS